MTNPSHQCIEETSEYTLRTGFLKEIGDKKTYKLKLRARNLEKEKKSTQAKLFGGVNLKKKVYKQSSLEALNEQTSSHQLNPQARKMKRRHPINTDKDPIKISRQWLIFKWFPLNAQQRFPVATHTHTHTTHRHMHTCTQTHTPRISLSAPMCIIGISRLC